MTRLLPVWLVFAALCAPNGWAAFDSAKFNQEKAAPSIQRVTPGGKDVPPGRQIVFQFNRPMVPVGKMERDAAEIPVTIAPTLNCQWRWLNTSALACQLSGEGQMKPATRYRVLMQPGIQAEDGATLVAPYSHTFITRRPKVNHARFQTWKHPGMPIVRLSFNYPVSRASVEQHIYLAPDQLRRVAVSAFPEKDKPGEPKPTHDRVWLVSPQTLLPEDTSVKLQVEPGLETNRGPERGVENRTVVGFDTFPEFRFLGVRCRDNQGDSLQFHPGEKPGLRRCNPLNSVALLFSAPVRHAQLQQGMRLTPDLAGGRTDYDPWQRYHDYTRLNRPHRRGNPYSVTLPELLKAYETYQIQPTDQALKDLFDRPLATPINLTFYTDHRKPDYHFGHEVAVLEKGVDSEVPIVVTNLDSLDLTFSRVTAQGTFSGLKHRQPVPKVEDVAFKMPLAARDIIKAPSGAVQGRLDTTPDIDRNWRQDWFFAQVTPYQVQVKTGHFNSLAWVTSLADGQPVAEVECSLYDAPYGEFPAHPNILATGKTDARGLARLPGLRDLDPELQKTWVYNRDKERFWIRCAKGEDLAVMPLDDRFALGMYDLSEETIDSDLRRQYGHIHTWGTTAQGVYKVGDTVQFKLLVRDQDNQRFVAAPKQTYQLTVTDPMDKVVYENTEITLGDFGGFHDEFLIAKNGAVGWYDFKLTASFSDHTWWPLRVLVSDFTPSPFKVATSVNGEVFQPGQPMTVDTTATLHAGGPYANAHAEIHVQLTERAFRSDHRVAKGFQFDTLLEDYYGDDIIHREESEVDAKGELQKTFNLPKDNPVLFGDLLIESTVRDDRGKDVAARARAKYVGRDRFVGLKQDQWILPAGQAAKLQVVVVDELGTPVTGWPVKVKFERRETKAARVKGAGNAYLTQYTHEWVDAGQCATQSHAEAVTCDFTPSQAGLYRSIAKIIDTKGREQATDMRHWVSGAGRVVWESSPGHGMSLLAEQDRYQVGDTARYLLKNPFPGAQALITVERYGVLKSWVKTLENSVEIIEVPVEADYIPGFFVSVTVMSPRVDKPLDANQVDLGKPAFRMGYAQTEVRDPYKEITVAIHTYQSEYRPREQVTLELQAQPRKPFAEGQAEPMELAVAVLDESVFALLSQGLGYFDPYQGFYTLDGLDLRNFNLLTHLVGRQKFDKKGANPGGDGGGDLSLRSLFKFVSYWNPSLATDAEGKATVTFDLPDNLTGWRVLAMAVTPTDRMGLGHGNFKVNQPLELRPVLPNQVTSGDRFQAGFSVMNRTAKPAEVTVELSAEGPLKLASGKAAKATRKMLVKPYQRALAWLPLETTGAGEIQLRAQARAGKEQDGLRKTLTVRKRRVTDTAATYGTTEQAEVSESIQYPKNIHADTGGLSVITAPTVISGLEGSFRYMRDYPYICWEQKLSKGVMASHYGELKPWLDLDWDGSGKLPAQTLELAANYQAPNGGMVYYRPYDRRASPYLSAYTALAFHWLRAAGHETPKLVEERLHGYLQNYLRKNTMPDFYSKGMASTVRAVALAALARAGKADAAEIRRFEPHVPEMSLFGKANFLDAALRVDGTDAQRAKTTEAILAHANQSGGKFTFNETLDDGYSRILASSVRDNCVILSALTLYGETPAGAKTVADVPFKLARTLTSLRTGRGYWSNTQENLFCLNALIDYARVYERTAPSMTVKASLDQETLGETKFQDRKDKPQTFARPMQAGDPGRKATLKLEKQGPGRLYYGVRLRYASTDERAERANAGIDIRREYHVQRDDQWQLLASPMHIETGELVRVDVYLDLPTAREFVVVDDPVPGGLEPVNRDLATSSQIAAGEAKGQYAGGSYWHDFGDWHGYQFDFWSFYHQELRHHAAIFYSEWLPAGRYHLSYTAQAIAPGTFSVMPVHAEEMYEPDVYGTGLPAKLEVTRAK